MDDHQLLTIAEFAKKLRHHPRTVYIWINRSWLTREQGLVVVPSGRFLIDWDRYCRYEEIAARRHAMAMSFRQNRRANAVGFIPPARMLRPC